jgi:hypothetical protein
VTKQYKNPHKKSSKPWRATKNIKHNTPKVHQKGHFPEHMWAVPNEKKRGPRV